MQRTSNPDADNVDAQSLMPFKPKNLTGKKFGRLVVIKQAGWTKARNARWLCKCACKKQTICAGGDLTSGSTVSCGCYRQENSRNLASKRFLKHGHAKKDQTTRIYNCWRDMVARCNRPSHNAYKYYGKRGILVCTHWLKFENFAADMAPMPKGLTLERRNNNGNYKKSNCCWATRKQQINNRRPQVEWHAPPGPHP